MKQSKNLSLGQLRAHAKRVGLQETESSERFFTFLGTLAHVFEYNYQINPDTKLSQDFLTNMVVKAVCVQEMAESKVPYLVMPKFLFVIASQEIKAITNRHPNPKDHPNVLVALTAENVFQHLLTYKQEIQEDFAAVIENENRISNQAKELTPLQRLEMKYPSLRSAFVLLRFFKSLWPAVFKS